MLEDLFKVTQLIKVWTGSKSFDSIEGVEAFLL